jgi:hypothetical protein
MAKRESRRLSVYLLPEQKVWLQEQADQNLSSLNSEVVRAVRRQMESEQTGKAG